MNPCECDSSYGYFYGGDPRDFRPDHECSTEDERKRHAEDCAKWNAGDHIDRGPDHKPGAPAEGETFDTALMVDEVVVHHHKASYGLGTTTWICDACEAPA